MLLSWPVREAGPARTSFHQPLLPFSPQLPAPPKFNFHIRDSWNSGIITMMSALSVAPSKAWEYSKEGWEYLKERTK